MFGMIGHFNHRKTAVVHVLESLVDAGNFEYESKENTVVCLVQDAYNHYVVVVNVLSCTVKLFDLTQPRSKMEVQSNKYLIPLKKQGVLSQNSKTIKIIPKFKNINRERGDKRNENITAVY
jgi:hypothetical protein